MEYEMDCTHDGLALNCGQHEFNFQTPKDDVLILLIGASNCTRHSKLLLNGTGAG